MKAWITRPILNECMKKVFCPSVKKYLQDNQLSLKWPLVMENAPAYPPELEDILLEEFQFYHSEVLPRNTTPLIQPMDQNVISNFKKLYSKAMFQRYFEIQKSDTELFLIEFGKKISTFSSALSS